MYNHAAWQMGSLNADLNVEKATQGDDARENKRLKSKNRATGAHDLSPLASSSVPDNQINPRFGQVAGEASLSSAVPTLSSSSRSLV